SFPAKLLLWIFVPVVCPGVPSSSMRIAPNGLTVQGGMLHGEKVGGDAPFMLKQLFCTWAPVAPFRISTPARPALVHVLPVIISLSAPSIPVPPRRMPQPPPAGPQVSPPVQSPSDVHALKLLAPPLQTSSAKTEFLSTLFLMT